MELIWWQIVILLGAFTACFLLIMNSIRKNKGVLKLKKKGEGTELTLTTEEQGKGDTEKITVKEPVDNSRAKDFIILIRKTINYADKKNEIVNSTIRDQMNTADLKMKQIELAMNKMFIGLLVEEFGNNVNLMQEISYVVFHNAMRIAICETLLKMKQSFRENHFDDKGDYEFEDYIQDQASRLYYSWELLFRTQYLTSLKPSFEKFKDKMGKQEENTLKSIFKDCFASAREISITKLRQLKELNDEFDEECRNFSGSDIAGVC